MSSLDFQIFTRNPVGGKEQEPNSGWTEHPRIFREAYDTDIPLWRPEGEDKNEGVFFDFHTNPEGGIGIVSNGKAEVFSRDMPLITTDESHEFAGVTIVNDRAYAQGGRAEIFFHYGAILGLTVKVKGQTVKEIQIVTVAAE